MGNAYRDERDAALAQIESLRRENDALRRQLEGGPPPEDPEVRAGALHKHFALFLLGGTMVFVASLLAVATAVHHAEWERARSELFDASLTVVTPLPADLAIDGRTLRLHGTRHVIGPLDPFVDHQLEADFGPYGRVRRVVQVPAGFDILVEMSPDRTGP